MNEQKNKAQDVTLHIEHTEIWMSDFGSHELERELRENVARLKPAHGRNPSWIFSSIGIVIFLVAAEVYMRQLALQNYWSEMSIFWMVWALRLALLIIWVHVAGSHWHMRRDKLLVITLIGFTLGVLGSAVVKIIAVPSTWAFLNLLVEPIWMLLLSGLAVSVYIKINNRK